MGSAYSEILKKKKNLFCRSCHKCAAYQWESCHLVTRTEDSVLNFRSLTGGSPGQGVRGEEVVLKVRLVRAESCFFSTFYIHLPLRALFQKLFGLHGTEKERFMMFQSQTKDLLFKDLTKCLVKLRQGITHKEFLGDEYYASVASLNTCNPSGKCNSLRTKSVNHSS